MENNTKNLNQESNAIEIDFKRVFSTVFKNLWKIIIVSLLCGALFFLGSQQFLTPMYRTSTSFYVNNMIALNGTSTSINPNDYAASVGLVNSYIAVLNQRDTLIRVIEHSNLNFSYNEIAGMISASAVKETEVFTVTVSSDDPEEAAAVANSIAHIVTTHICDIIEGSSAKVITYPVVPSSPYSPNHFKNAVFGVLIGLIASTGIVVIIEVLDTKIKSENDIKNCCHYPVLAVVPDMTKTTKQGYYSKRYSSRYGYYAATDAASDKKTVQLVGKDVNFTSKEAYKLLRTKLQYSLADVQEGRVFVVSSALAGAGKSVTSINLAYSLSQLNKRVLLIDGDMRCPTLAKKLSLSNYPGLSEYLTGFMGLDELLQTYKDDTEQMPLNILAAGNTPPNPVELISSAKMSHAIEDLRKQYDYIIIDMPPICDVSDALVAAKIADGVLLVVRNNYCTSTAVQESIQQFEFVNAKIVGVVFNCFSEKNNKYYIKHYGNKYADHYANPRHSVSEKHNTDKESSATGK